MNTKRLKTDCPARLPITVVAAMVTLVLVGAFSGSALAAPAACGGSAQIVDLKGDGHHNTTDVLSAWIAESPGSLQAVIKVAYGNWYTDHADDGSVEAGFALIYTVGSQQRYVRLTAPVSGPLAYDYGTYVAPSGFLTEGSTTGSVVHGTDGTATVDLPQLAVGTVIERPYVLTWDGIEDGLPHWVDRAPGGTSVEDTSYGADFVVGTCIPGAFDSNAVLATKVAARSVVRGTQRVAVSGSILPARSGVPVQITLKGLRSRVLETVTAADGSFSVSPKVGETSTVSAVAGGRASGAITITMRSKTSIRIVRRAGGKVIVRGRTNPALPGKVLFLRDGDYRSTARVNARNGRFTIRLRRPRKGRYVAVYIPTNGRAERSTSNRGKIR